MSQSTIVKPHDPNRGSGFWGKVAEVADFLFATKSIGRLATGQGGWGDLANVGITAASFFIPGAKLLKFGPEALRAVVAEGERVVASEVSQAAKNSAKTTIDNARFLLDNPGLHKNLYSHIQTIPDGETVGKNLLDNIETDAENFLRHRGGSVSNEPYSLSVSGSYPLRDAEGNIVYERIGTRSQERSLKEEPIYGEPVDVPIVTGPGERTGISKALWNEGEDIYPDLSVQFELEREIPDYIKYPFLAPEDIAYYRGMGKSETYIKNANEWEKSLGSKTGEPVKINTADLPPRDYKVQPLTEEEMIAAEWNKVHQVNAEFPTSPEGKPYTLREHEAIPPELSSGDENVDRAAWLQSQMAKLTNLLKSGKAKSPGEIRATINKYQLEYTSTARNLDAGQHATVNDLADKLKAYSLAERDARNAAIKRGVVPFKIETATFEQLVAGRQKLLKDLEAETDPNAKQAIIFLGKKIRARMDALRAGSVVAGGAIASIANVNQAEAKTILPNIQEDKKNNSAKKYLDSIKIYNGEPNSYKVTDLDKKYLPYLSIKDLNTWMAKTNSDLTNLPSSVFGKSAYYQSPHKIINTILKMNGGKLITPNNFTPNKISSNYDLSKDVINGGKDFLKSLTHEIGHLLDHHLLKNNTNLIKSDTDSLYKKPFVKYNNKIYAQQIEEIRAQLWAGTLNRLSGIGNFTSSDIDYNTNIWDPSTVDAGSGETADSSGLKHVMSKVNDYFDRHGSITQALTAEKMAYNNPLAWLDYLGLKYPSEWKTQFKPLDKTIPNNFDLPKDYQPLTMSEGVKGKIGQTINETIDKVAELPKHILQNIFGSWGV